MIFFFIKFENNKDAKRLVFYCNDED